MTLPKNTYLLALLLLVFIKTAAANQPLTMAVINDLQKTSKAFQRLDNQFPEMDAEIERLGEKTDKIVKYIENSAAYPQVKAILAKSEFNSLTDFFAVSKRIMNGIMSVQMSMHMPDMANGNIYAASEKIMTANIQRMKDKGAPAAAIAEMEQKWRETQLEQKLNMEQITSTSGVDKKFITENFQSIIQLFSQYQQ